MRPTSLARPLMVAGAAILAGCSSRDAPTAPGAAALTVENARSAESPALTAPDQADPIDVLFEDMTDRLLKSVGAEGVPLRTALLTVAGRPGASRATAFSQTTMLLAALERTAPPQHAAEIDAIRLEYDALAQLLGGARKPK